MRCYFVLVHGRLEWELERSPGDQFGAVKPAGFYCHRYVLAANESAAAEIALRRVQQNLDSQTAWLRDGFATVELDAERVNAAPLHKLLKPDNRGHSFYERD